MEEMFPAAIAAVSSVGALDLGLSKSVLFWLWIGILVYVIGMLLIGFLCSKKIKGMEDFLVAGRRLPLWMATATLLATWFGAGSSMGVAATVFTDGIGGVRADPFGASISLIIAGIFVVGFLRKAKCLTVTDIVARKYGKAAGVYTSLWMIPVYVGWLGAQMMGLGVILNILTGIDMIWGTLISAAVVLTYTMVGGMWAVTMTDIIQVSLIIIGLLCIIPGAVSESGGWTTLIQSIPAEHLTLRPGPEVKSLTDKVYYIGSWIVMGLGCVVGQDLIQRSLASKTDRVAISSSVMAGFFYALIALVPICIGFAARLVFPKYGIQVGEDLENQVLPNMAILVLGKMSPFVLVLFLSALISAIMSSADSSLLAGTSLLVNNVIHPCFPNMKDKQLLTCTRAATLLFTIVALALALGVKSIYALMINSWASQLVIIFVPVVAAIYFPKASKNCAWSAMAVSTAMWIGYVFFDSAGIQLEINGRIVSGWNIPFTTLMNCDAFDRSLTCGAVYGFASGVLAFFFAYFGERMIHWVTFWRALFARTSGSLGLPEEKPTTPDDD